MHKLTKLKIIKDIEKSKFKKYIKDPNPYAKIYIFCYFLVWFSKAIFIMILINQASFLTISKWLIKNDDFCLSYEFINLLT